jgi:DNA-binding winged helix-turn-helix (wHTH) protein/Tol biopolymer transport system component
MDLMQDDPVRTLAFHPSAASVVWFGAFRLDLSDGLLSREGVEVRLPPRALAILRHLVERAGRVVAKEALLDAAWNDAHVSESSLTEAIGLIRHALGDDPQQPLYIQTVHRRGYRFIATIGTAAPASAPSQNGFRAPDAHAGLTEPALPNPASRPDRRRMRVALSALGASALLLVGGVFGWNAQRDVPVRNAVRVSLAVPSSQAPAPGPADHPAITISPDGRQIVYVGGPPGSSRLFLRAMDRFEAIPLPGTDGAHGPFISPDGEWVGFFAGGYLKRLRVSRGDGDTPQILCATPAGVGGSWLSKDEIVFTPNWTGPLMRISVAGGEPVVAAAPRTGRNYRWPDRLDDQTIIATRWQSNPDDAAVVAVSPASGVEQVLATRATFGRYTAAGHLLFLRDGDLYAVRLDPATHRTQGEPVHVLSRVLTGTTGAAQIAVSSSGSLLYIADVPERSFRSVARVDTQGTVEDLPVAPRAFRSFDVCGEHFAATVLERGKTDLWTGRADRAALTRITHEGSTFDPIWSADCRTITFGWNRNGVSNLYTVRIDSGEAPRLLFGRPVPDLPGSWSADDRWLSYVETSADTLGDVWLWDRASGRRRPVVTTAGYEMLPHLSPDGARVAYETNVSGTLEIEIAAIATGARMQVSSGGGEWPAWSADGSQLFFLHGSKHYARAVPRSRRRNGPRECGSRVYQPGPRTVSAHGKSIHLAQKDRGGSSIDANGRDPQLVWGAGSTTPLNRLLSANALILGRTLSQIAAATGPTSSLLFHRRFTPDQGTDCADPPGQRNETRRNPICEAPLGIVHRSAL